MAQGISPGLFLKSNKIHYSGTQKWIDDDSADAMNDLTPQLISTKTKKHTIAPDGHGLISGIVAPGLWKEWRIAKTDEHHNEELEINILRQLLLFD